MKIYALRDSGSSIVIVGHRLIEIFALSDRVTIFRNGRHVLTCPTVELDGPALVRAMIGRDVEHSARAARLGSREAESPKFVARGLSVEGGRGPIDFAIRSGEIVAIVGQLGSGANAYLEVFAGFCAATGYKLKLDGKPIQLNHIGDAYRNGISYVAEDWAIRGLSLGASIEVNMTCQILGEISPWDLFPRASATTGPTRLQKPSPITPVAFRIASRHSAAATSKRSRSPRRLPRVQACYLSTSRHMASISAHVRSGAETPIIRIADELGCWDMFWE